MNKLSKRKIYVLIPTHNRKELLCSTLFSVSEQLSKNEITIVVVDAGSTDGTYDALSSKFPFVHIVKGHSDMWWTSSVNGGLNYIAQTASAGDRVLLMNDDIDLSEKALSNLLDASELNQRAIIGALNIVQKPKEKPYVYFCGGKYDMYFARHKSNISQGTPWDKTNKRFFESDYLYGRLMLIPWEVFQLCGKFDEENFPQYAADEDFTYRAKLQGFDILVDTLSMVYVNEETTARFSLDYKRNGWRDFINALIFLLFNFITITYMQIRLKP
mgnify:CR=1 FL=1